MFFRGHTYIQERIVRFYSLNLTPVSCEIISALVAFVLTMIW
jgi:hypothetical protein